MSEKNTRKQIRTLYLMTTVGYFQIAAASLVALLALRGFSLLQIGMLESIFHIVSLCFELPSGVVADCKSDSLPDFRYADDFFHRLCHNGACSRMQCAQL